jgi:hypothetical protein
MNSPCMLYGKTCVRPNLTPEHSVPIECGADQREMCKGLREITQRLALRSCLF